MSKVSQRRYEDIKVNRGPLVRVHSNDFTSAVYTYEISASHKERGNDTYQILVGLTREDLKDLRRKIRQALHEDSKRI